MVHSVTRLAIGLVLSEAVLVLVIVIVSVFRVRVRVETVFSSDGNLFKKDFEQPLSRRTPRTHAPRGLCPRNPGIFSGIGSENHLFIAPKTIPVVAQGETDEGSVGTQPPATVRVIATRRS